MNNVVLVSGGQQSDSVISVHIHTSILSQILFLCWLLHNIQQSSLSIQWVFAGNPFYLFIYLVTHFKYIRVYRSIPNSPTIPSPPL